MSSPDLENIENEGVVIEIVIPIQLAEHLALGEINLSHFCRICFNESTNMVSMFEDCKPFIADIFTLFTSIQVNCNDNSPTNICQTCREQIINCYEFKQQCEKSDIIWKSTLNSEFIKKIKEEPKVVIDAMNNEKPFQDSLPEDDDPHNKEENDAINNEEPFQDSLLEDDDTNNNEENNVIQLSEVCKEDYLNLELEHINYDRIDETLPLKKYDGNIKSCKDNVQSNEVKESLAYYECGHCSKGFTKLRSLKQHIRMIHPVKSNFPCKFCKEAYNIQLDLHIHSSVHEGNGLTCNQCSKTFVTKSRLRRHLQQHMVEKRFKCDSCDKEFCERTPLKRHQRTHTGEVIEKKHACEMCDKRFASGYALRVHSVYHTGRKQHVCAICARAFASASALRSHMRIHDDRKPYQCHYCNKRYRHESVLNTHLRTHTGERPYVCAVCGKTFIQNSNLSLHMKVHSEERSYECIICKRTFKVISTLKAHMITHSAEKPFKCDLCGKRFSRKYMGAHMMRHTGERPHACSACPKRFLSATALRYHNRLHTGEKPYECNVCGKKFHTKTHIRTHLKTHIGKKKSQRRKTYQKKSTNKNKVDELNVAVESLGLSKFLDSEVDVTAIDCIRELELRVVDENSTTEYIVLEPDQNAVKVTTFTRSNNISL